VAGREQLGGDHTADVTGAAGNEQPQFISLVRAAAFPGGPSGGPRP
jgi:hypothetical protein